MITLYYCVWGGDWEATTAHNYSDAKLSFFSFQKRHNTRLPCFVQPPVYLPTMAGAQPLAPQVPLLEILAMGVNTIVIYLTT